jgi:hypothetical protein
MQRYVMSLVLGFCVLGSALQSDALTQAQCTTLRTDIVTTHAVEFAELIAGGSVIGLRQAYAAPAAPTFWVWKTSVPPEDYRGAIVWTEVDALSAGDARIFEWMTGQLTLPINAADPNVRQGMADAFGAGTTTRANLLTLSRRPAVRGERLFATGTGSTGSPGTLVIEGVFSLDELTLALHNRCNELP